MVLALPDWAAIVVSSAVWAVGGIAIGWVANRWSSERVGRDGPVTRLRAWERGGRAYERLGIRRWKDRLPEAGAWFRGGVSKRALVGADRPGLEAFAAETRRAERAHWLNLCLGPVHALWCRPLLALAMVAWGVGFNAPFIVIQRYNRGRIARALARGTRSQRP